MLSDCGNGACVNSACSCDPQAATQCQGAEVWFVDCNGDPSSAKESCLHGCEAGACLAEPPGPSGDFDRECLISDALFREITASSEATVQAFLDGRSGRLKEAALGQTFDFSYPGTVDYDTVLGNGELGRTSSPAAVIHYSGRFEGDGQHVRINPRVLLATLQKEQGLIDSYAKATQGALDWAMGYAVFEGAGPTPAYKGFFGQVLAAAWQFDHDFEQLEPGVQPPITVDGVTLTPKNRATAVLYKYTPHLSAGELFWTLWTQYFGGSGACEDVTPPTSTPTVSSVTPGAATAGKKTTFAVNGQHLPDTLALWIGGCWGLERLSHQPDTVTYSCIPTGIGPHDLVVKDAPDGVVLFDGSIQVSAAPPSQAEENLVLHCTHNGPYSVLAWPFEDTSWYNATGSPYHYGDDRWAEDLNLPYESSLGQGCNVEIDEGPMVAHAAASGTILYVGDADNGYGFQVVIRLAQDPTFALRYTHLQPNDWWKVGDSVSLFDPIGAVGNSNSFNGSSAWMCAHLHVVLYCNIDAGSTAETRLQGGRSPKGLTGGPSSHATWFTFDKTMLPGADYGGGIPECANVGVGEDGAFIGQDEVREGCLLADDSASYWFVGREGQEVLVDARALSATDASTWLRLTVRDDSGAPVPMLRSEQGPGGHLIVAKLPTRGRYHVTVQTDGSGELTYRLLHDAVDDAEPDAWPDALPVADTARPTAVEHELDRDVYLVAASDVATVIELSAEAAEPAAKTRVELHQPGANGAVPFEGAYRIAGDRWTLEAPHGEVYVTVSAVDRGPGFYTFAVGSEPGPGDVGPETPDAVGPDAGGADAAGPVAGDPDAGGPDVGGNDVPAISADAKATGGSTSSGCEAGRSHPAAVWLLLALWLFWLGRRWRAGGSAREDRA